MEGLSKTIHIQVTADDRELKSGVIEALRAMEGVTVKIERLPVGDYEVDGRLLFERKTLIDFVAAIKDGRLFRQANKLASSSLQTAIILEGRSSDLASSGMHREAIQGALITLSMRYGIPILRSMTPDESARLMFYAANQIHTEKKEICLRRGKLPKGKRRLQHYVLQGLPGIGPRKAHNLIEHFGSIEAVVNARPEDLTSIPGIGYHTARAIRQTVREEQAQYICSF